MLSVVGARRGSLIDIWQLATGKRQQKYVVSTSNRVVINFECGAPTKKKTQEVHMRQGELVARILTHAQQSSSRQRGSAAGAR